MHTTPAYFLPTFRLKHAISTDASMQLSVGIHAYKFTFMLQHGAGDLEADAAAEG